MPSVYLLFSFSALWSHLRTASRPALRLAGHFNLNRSAANSSGQFKVDVAYVSRMLRVSFCATTFDFAREDSLTNPTNVMSLASVLRPAPNASQNQLLLIETISI